MHDQKESNIVVWEFHSPLDQSHSEEWKSDVSDDRRASKRLIRLAPGGSILASSCRLGSGHGAWAPGFVP